MRNVLLALVTFSVLGCGSSQPAEDAKPTTTSPASASNRPAADVPAPCDSHTTCYVGAKEAHATGETSGYQLAVAKCEHYRGAYQLEKFYGLCLLITADSYLHLGDFDKARDRFQRVLDTHGDDPELGLPAQDGLNELDIGAKEPRLYARYLEALALLARYNHSSDASYLPKAKAMLRALRAEKPTWGLSDNVDSVLQQVDATLAAGGE